MLDAIAHWWKLRKMSRTMARHHDELSRQSDLAEYAVQECREAIRRRNDDLAGYHRREFKEAKARMDVLGKELVAMRAEYDEFFDMTQADEEEPEAESQPVV